MRLLLWIALISIVVVALVMFLRPSGPRVTRIEDRRDRNEEEGDDA